MPSWMLQGFVAKEIALARAHGVQVYTIVIGDSIDDNECKKMFGHHKYWKKATPDKVGSELSKLVLTNFNKYLTSRS